MKMSLPHGIAAALVFQALPAIAHEMTELTVAAITTSRPGLYKLSVPDTDPGVPLACAVYDAGGKLITSTVGISTALVTTILVTVPGDGAKVASARCAVAN